MNRTSTKLKTADGTMPDIRTLNTRDFDEMAQAFVRWDHRFEQLSRGRFHGQIRFADFDGIQLFDLDVNVVIRCRGARMPDSFTFSFVEPANADAVWRGRVLRPGMVNVLAPSHEMDHRTSRNDYRQTALTVRRDVLERMTPELLGIELQDLFATDPALQVETSRSEVLVGRYREILRALDAADGGPPMRAAGVIDPGELVAGLLRTLADGRIADPFRITPPDRRRVVREVEEYVRSLGTTPVTILQLCKLTGVSERALHYAFSEVTGLSPKAYLRAVQLNEARRELTRSIPRRGQVVAVGRRHGFHRPGSFASDFRRHFGELPSELLGRRGR